MGVAMPRPSWIPNIAENNSENFIDHKLLDGDGILKKYQPLIVATPLRVAKLLKNMYLIFFWIRTKGI